MRRSKGTKTLSFIIALVLVVTLVLGVLGGSVSSASSSLRKENAKLKQQIEQVQKDNKTLQDNNSKLINDNNSLKDKNSLLESDKTTLQEEIGNMYNYQYSLDIDFYVDSVLYISGKARNGGALLVSPTEPTKSGYNFKGWSKTENGEVIDLATTTFTTKTRLYAVFEKEEPSINLADCSGAYSKISSDDASNNAPTVSSITLEDVEIYNEKVKEIILNVNDINNVNPYTLSEQYTKLMNAENSDLDAFDFIIFYSKCSGTFSSKSQNITFECESAKKSYKLDLLVIVIDTQTGKMTCQQISNYDEELGKITFKMENGWTENTIFAICEKITSENTETWVLNETLTDFDNFSVDINFTSNGENYTHIDITKNGYLIDYVNDDGAFSVVSPDGWLDDAYRTITFSESVTDETLLAWLEANGTRQ